MKWPMIATGSRFILASLGGWYAINYFSIGLNGVFYSAALAMTLYGLILVISLKLGAWRKN
jgi:Na+-driven multidrug efflux pump